MQAIRCLPMSSGGLETRLVRYSPRNIDRREGCSPYSVIPNRRFSYTEGGSGSALPGLSKMFMSSERGE